MKCRLATPLDAERLVQIENSQPMCAHWGQKGWGSEIKNTSAQIWCWEEDGEVVGFVAARIAAGLGEILNVAVLPAYTRKGVGFRLLTRLLAEARSQGVERMTLEVNVRNVAAISLYSKAGFNEAGRRKKFYNQQDDALIMGKDLCANG